MHAHTYMKAHACTYTHETHAHTQIHKHTHTLAHTDTLALTYVIDQNPCTVLSYPPLPPPPNPFFTNSLILSCLFYFCYPQQLFVLVPRYTSGIPLVNGALLPEIFHGGWGRVCTHQHSNIQYYIFDHNNIGIVLVRVSSAATKHDDQKANWGEKG